jgi:hypothetical protein
VILRLGELFTGLTAHHRELACFRMLYRALDLDGFCGTTYTMENGHEILKLKCQESIGQAYRK